MRSVSPHHHRTTAKWSGFLDVAGDIGGIFVPPPTGSSIIQDFVGSINISPRCKIPSVAYITACQPFDRHPGSVSTSRQLIPYLNGPVGNSVTPPPPPPPLQSCCWKKEQRSTSRNNTLSSRGDGLRGCPGRFLS